MKKVLGIIFTIILILGAAIAIRYFYIKYQNSQDLKRVKAGWHVEVITEYINLRRNDNRSSDKIGTVKKGNVFEVLEFKKDKSFFWYKIEYKKNKYGWIANNTDLEYLKDVHNPDDIMAPTVKLTENTYKVESIDKINYDHLIIIDDRNDYTVTHVVYHELDKPRNVDQYWIKYTVIDGADNKVVKTQKISFEKKPDENKVEKWSY